MPLRPEAGRHWRPQAWIGAAKKPGPLLRWQETALSGSGVSSFLGARGESLGVLQSTLRDGEWVRRMLLLRARLVAPQSLLQADRTTQLVPGQPFGNYATIRAGNTLMLWPGARPSIALRRGTAKLMVLPPSGAPPPPSQDSKTESD